VADRSAVDAAGPPATIGGSDVLLWRSRVNPNLGARRVAPTPGNGLLFTAGVDGGVGSTLYSLDTATGRLVWQRDVLGLSSPVVAAGRIFVANTHGQVFAFRSADGLPLWEQKNGYSGAAAVGVDGRWVYTNDWEVGLSVFDAASGKAIGWAGGTRGTVAGGRVWKEYAGGYRVFDAATGTELGQAGIGCAGQEVGQTHAFAVCHDEIYSIDLKNYAVKSLAPGTGPVALDGNRLYYTYVDSVRQEPRVAAMIVTP
jgi:outer membrane protein assembly factor BamB